MDSHSIPVWLYRRDGTCVQVLVDEEYYKRVVALGLGPDGDSSISFFDPAAQRASNGH
jgi:hypothetical protein